MYNFLHKILQDHTGSAVFAPYNLWHCLYLVLLIGSITAIGLLLKNKSEKIKTRAVDLTISLAFGLYMADFFLMPFSYGYVDIDKLPFHICTLMSVMCFASRHNAFLGRFKTAFTMMGLVGALIYVAYPAGVANGEVSIFSYRILQTLLFHGLMVAYGVWSLLFGDAKPTWRTSYKDLGVISANILLAVIANHLYSGVENGRSFNWCFIVSDPLCIIPDSVAPYVMPFIIIAIFFAIDMLIYLIYRLLTQKRRRI